MNPDSRTLPGEHGLHTRDGSLLKKKREQWEKEKAESAPWFPFGDDAARSSARAKSETRQQHTSDKELSVPSIVSCHENIQSMQTVPHPATPPLIPMPSNATPISAYPFLSPTSYHHQIPMAMTPQGQQISPASYASLFQPPIVGANFQPSSFLPAWSANSPQMAYQCTAVTGASDDPRGRITTMTTTPPVAVLPLSIPQIAYSAAAMETVSVMTPPPPPPPDFSTRSQPDVPQNYRTVISIGASTNAYQPYAQDVVHVEKTLKRTSIEKQIEARRQLDEQLAEQDRHEIEVIKRENESQMRRRQQEEAEVAERQKHVHEAMEANKKSYQDLIEKARIESDVLRKAKLHKHRLLDPEVSMETIQKILGTTDSELVKRVLKDLKELERQKRIDFENLNLSHSSPGHQTIHGSGGGAGCHSARSAATSGSQAPLSSDRPIAPQRRNVLKSPVNSEQTPLSRLSSGRASLRAPSVQSSVAKNRRSGSAERPRLLPTSQSRDASRSATAAPERIADTRSQKTRTPPKPKPRSRIGSATLTKSQLTSSLKRRADPNLTNLFQQIGVSCSMTSMSSAKTTVIGDSPFIENLPRIRTSSSRDSNLSEGEVVVSVSDDSQFDENRPHFSKNSVKPLVPPKPTSIMVNRSMQDENAESNVRVNSGVQYVEKDGAFNVEQCFQLRQTPLDSLRQYEAIVSNFSPILRTTSTLTNTTAGIFHAEAVRYLSGLDNATSFEPVKTRNKMRHELRDAEAAKGYDVASRSTGECYHESYHESHVRRDSNNVNDMELSQQQSKISDDSSSGASTNITPFDSSPISSSPPLSSGCKSSSSIENHGMDILESNDGTPRAKSNATQKFCALRTGASGSSEDLSIESNKSVERGHLFGMLHTNGSSSNRHDGPRSLSSRRHIGDLNNFERPPASPFAQKLAESGSRRNLNDHPEVLRRNMQSPTMKHLQESLGNLSSIGDSPSRQNVGSTDVSEAQSRPITPKPFNCQSMQYRSLNLKGRSQTERQQRILEQLASVRARLKDRQLKIEKSLPNRNFTSLSNPPSSTTSRTALGEQAH